MRLLTGSLITLAFLSVIACTTSKKVEQQMQTPGPEFKYLTEQFADLKILRYRVPGFNDLTARRKELVYYLYQAALSGRDITWDQNYRHNLCIRRTLENIYLTYKGDRDSEDFKKFEVYLKRVWFSSGIHHHYSTNKFLPAFSKEYFAHLVENSDQGGFPLTGSETVEQLAVRLTPVMFDADIDAKKVNLDPNADLVKGSANNFYEGVTQKEAEEYYAKIIDPDDPRPVSYGLNSKLVKENGRLKEKMWKLGGMYTQAIEKIVYWLEKAVAVAENEKQKAALEKLVEYYKAGDLKLFDEYNILWVQDTESTVDVINGFIETYDDAMGYRATYESLVQLNDTEATRRVAAIAANAQWFEDNSPIMPGHKKKSVKGISARAIDAVVGSGAVSPSSPIGINLPNANWIRAEHGSKSVTISNLVHSYHEVGRESGEIEEFTLREEDIALHKKYGHLAGVLNIDLHEVIGHGSGRLEPGVGTPKETLKNYYATLEEARADLVALYYIPDVKLIEIGVAPSLEVGRVSYNGYITSGLLRQLKRIKPGEDIEEAHMRNRQLVASWAYEKGRPDNVIEKVVQHGKTYFMVNDYEKLRELFGTLLREVQRIKSEGDYEAGRALVETYGVKVDRELHQEVLERFRKLAIAPYSGFINPVLRPVTRDGEIIDVEIEYPDDFTGQMLYYAREYSSLPTYN